MDFITSALLGGILYDTTKQGLSYLNDNLKTLIKGYVFSDEEIATLTLISEEVSKQTSFTRDDFTKALDANDQISNVIKNLHQQKVSVQINNIGTNNGAVMGDNHGTINFGKQS